MDIGEYVTLIYPNNDTYMSVGLLGIKIPLKNYSAEYATSLRMHEIERRILRIEEAIKATGFDINTIPME